MTHAPLGQGAKKVKLPAKAQNKTAAASGGALLPYHSAQELPERRPPGRQLHNPGSQKCS